MDQTDWLNVIAVAIVAFFAAWHVTRRLLRKREKPNEMRVTFTLKTPEMIADFYKMLSNSGKPDLQEMAWEMLAVYEQFTLHRKAGKELFMRDPHDPVGPETRFVFSDDDDDGSSGGDGSAHRAADGKTDVSATLPDNVVQLFPGKGKKS